MFSCPPGMVLIGPNSSTCTENGEWEPGLNQLTCSEGNYSVMVYRIFFCQQSEKNHAQLFLQKLCPVYIERELYKSYIIYTVFVFFFFLVATRLKVYATMYYYVYM